MIGLSPIHGRRWKETLTCDILDGLYRKSGQTVALALMASVVLKHYGRVGLVVTRAPIHHTRGSTRSLARFDL